MPRTYTVDAIVLRTHDVGEADRFCILLTRERGRLAARANGVRKPRSKIGGCILPMHRITVDLTETSRGCIITGARRHPDCTDARTMETFLAGQELTELLLLLLHDGEPLPDVFDFAANLLRTVPTQPRSSLPLTVRLFRLLGLMPEHGSPLFAALSSDEHRIAEQWANGDGISADVISPQAECCLQDFCASLLEEHSGRRSRVPVIAETMRVMVGKD